MNEIAYAQLSAMAATPEAMSDSVDYLFAHISPFLKKRERVLICFANTPGSIGNLMAQAIERCEAVPVFPEDLRWKTLLREAFSRHCSAILGTPLLVLGLSKLAKRMDTPLYARNVILAGYPAAKWMIDGIRMGLDCRMWGCFEPCVGPVIAGFSCDCSVAIHLREDQYGAKIVDSQGIELDEGEFGEIVIYPVSKPEIQFHTGDFGRINSKPCACGCKEIRITDFDTVLRVDKELSQLGAQLHMWTSILDCKMARTEYGLELEIVTFPGEKLPKLPSCAKLVVRNWNPDTDIPFPYMYMLKNRHFSLDKG